MTNEELVAHIKLNLEHLVQKAEHGDVIGARAAAWRISSALTELEVKLRLTPQPPPEAVQPTDQS